MRRSVARFSVCKQSAFARLHFVAEVLIPLPAAHIFLEQQIVAALGVIGSAIHRFREKRQLLPRAAGHFDYMRLERVPESRSYDHFPPRRMPIRLKRNAAFRVTPNRFSERCRYTRDVFHHHALRRHNRRFLRRKRYSRKQTRCTRCHPFSSHGFPHSFPREASLIPETIEHANEMLPSEPITPVLVFPRIPNQHVPQNSY